MIAFVITLYYFLLLIIGITAKYRTIPIEMKITPMLVLIILSMEIDEMSKANILLLTITFIIKAYLVDFLCVHNI
jgi:hypothetical protein